MKKIFSKLHYIFLSTLYLFMSHPAIARDLESIATNLTSKTSRLAMAIIPIGFAIAGMFMALGHPRGSSFMSMTLMAAIVTLGGSATFSWLKTIVG